MTCQYFGVITILICGMGSIRAAEALFEAIIRNAFPTNDFRRLELIRIDRAGNILEAPNEWGKSTWCAFLTAMFRNSHVRRRAV